MLTYIKHNFKMNNKNNLNISLKDEDVTLVSPLKSDCNSELLKEQELLGDKINDTSVSLTIIPTETVHTDTRNPYFCLLRRYIIMLILISC